MNSHSGHRERQGGFTVSEVVLAIGVVAFGLVAVLGVLPAGLSVVKDNREETIIRYEARYWINALRAGMQQFDALDQVEWVEIQLWDSTLDPDNDDPSEVYRVHRTRLGADGGGYLPSSGLDTGDTNSFSMGAVKQSSWPQDVIGWLSIPNPLKDGTRAGWWVKKTALVRPLNSTLFDRINGRKLLVAKKTDKAGKADGDFVYHPIPGGDLAFSYLLEVEVKPDNALMPPPPQPPKYYEVNLTFKWPVLDDPTQKDDPGRSPASPWASKNTSTNVTFVSKMKFKSLGMVERAICKDKLILMQTTPERVEAAKAILDVIGAEVPGFEVTIDELLSQSPLIVEFSHIQDVLKDLTLVVPDFKKVMKKIPVPISEVERWRLIQRPYEGQGLYSMRQVFPGPAGSTLENGGYEPKLIRWGHLGRFSWLLDPFRNERFQGFKPAANYFDQLYFLTPDNQ
jgi:type II secretory pathway pseudopilin PulG